MLGELLEAGENIITNCFAQVNQGLPGNVTGQDPAMNNQITPTVCLYQNGPAGP